MCMCSFDAAKGLLADPRAIGHTRRAVIRVLYHCKLKEKDWHECTLCVTAAVLIHVHAWKLIEDERLGEAIRDAAADVLYHFEGMVLMHAHKALCAEGLSDVCEGLWPAMVVFWRLYEDWRDGAAPEVQMLERAMELVRMHFLMEGSAHRAPLYRRKRRRLEAMGGAKLLDAWIDACALMRRKKVVLVAGSGSAVMRKEETMQQVHARLIVPVEAEQCGKADEETHVTLKEWVMWELICMELMLKPRPYCGRLLCTVWKLRQEASQACSSSCCGFSALDMEVMQDVMEASAWDHASTDELVRKLIKKMDAAVLQRWEAFFPATRAHGWAVGLCASLQFVQNELNRMKAPRCLEELFAKGIRMELEWFLRNEELAHTRQWIREGLKRMGTPSVRTVSLVTFHRELMLNTLLRSPSPECTQLLPEIMVLDRPHVEAIQGHVQFWAQVLGLVQSLEHSPFIWYQPSLRHTLMDWLVLRKGPQPRVQEEGVLHLLLCARTTVEAETMRAHFRAMLPKWTTRAYEEVTALCRTFVERLYAPQQHVLWCLYGERMMRPMLMRMLRLIHVNFRVHYSTYLRLIDEANALEPRGYKSVMMTRM